MNTPTATEFLLGGGAGKSAFSKDDPIGTTVTGTVIETTVRQQTDIATGQPLTWDNGDPRMQLVVTLQTDQRIPGEPDDDGIRALYVKGSKAPGSQSLHDAVRAAVQAAGAPGLEPGGQLTVQLVGTEPSKTRGYNDRKLWAAAYIAPDPAAASAQFLQPAAVPQAAVGGQPAAPAMPPISQPAAQPVSAPVPVPASIPQAAPVAAPTPAPPQGHNQVVLVRNLSAAGLTDEQIAGQLGLDVSVVQILKNSPAA